MILQPCAEMSKVTSPPRPPRDNRQARQLYLRSNPLQKDVALMTAKRRRLAHQETMSDSPASSTSKLSSPPERKPDPRKPWYSNRKIVFSLILGLAVAVAIAVAVPLVVLRRKDKRTFSEQELFFPAGSSSGVFGSRKSVQQYDILIVTGSSYSDNAHPRAANLARTMAGDGYWVCCRHCPRISHFADERHSVVTGAMVGYGSSTCKTCSTSPFSTITLTEEQRYSATFHQLVLLQQGSRLRPIYRTWLQTHRPILPFTLAKHSLHRSPRPTTSTACGRITLTRPTSHTIASKRLLLRSVHQQQSLYRTSAV